MENNRPIPAPKSSLGNLLQGGVAALQMEVMKASATHGGYFGHIPQEGAVEHVGRAMEMAEAGNTAIGRGDTVFDTKHRRRGTVIRVLKAAAKDGSRKMEIVDSEGDAWIQRESRLKKK